MIETGYMLLQYQTLGRTLDAEMYERLLQRLTRHRIRGRVYSVDIVYVFLLDGRGDIIAFAADPDIQNVTEEGKLLNPERSVLGLQLLRFVNSDRIDEYRDIQPMNIELEGYPQLLKMGYRKSITGRVASEISARYFTLAVLLIIAGVLVAIYFVGRLIRPLEKLTVAVGRIAAGDYDVPVLAPGTDEFDSLSRSMSRIVEDLQVAAMVRKTMFRSAIGTQQSLDPETLPPVILVTDTPDSPEVGVELSEDEVAAYTNAIIAAVSENEGEFFDHRAGRSIAAWGQTQPERDDTLRAVIAGLQILNFIRSGESSSPLEQTRLVVDFRPQQPIADILQRLDALTEEMPDDARLYLTADAYREVQRHVSAKSIGQGDFFEVFSLGEDDTMTQIAASPDE
ncbi:MAG: HAMP domain-containing protein [Armatimonadota bacterium]